MRLVQRMMSKREQRKTLFWLRSLTRSNLKRNSLRSSKPKRNRIMRNWPRRSNNSRRRKSASSKNFVLFKMVTTRDLILMKVPWTMMSKVTWLDQLTARKWQVANRSWALFLDHTTRIDLQPRMKWLNKRSSIKLALTNYLIKWKRITQAYWCKDWKSNRSEINT